MFPLFSTLAAPPTKTPHDSQLPITGSAGHEAYFDVDAATPGDFVHPVLFDDEVWPRNSTAEMAWIYFKGDPMSGPTPDHPFEDPFEPSTLFNIDLLLADRTTVQNVMRE